jgi:murein DD-endopeptidase MepM/ murein hydrolase activator NlpD
VSPARWVLALVLVVAPPTSRDAPCLVAPVAATVTRTFEQPACRWCAGHRGVRYATRSGQAVVAAASGSVLFSGTVAGRTWVTIALADHWLVTVGPLIASTVVVGSRVDVGDAVGRAGSWLMLTVRAAGSAGEYVDPAALVSSRRGVPRLVPEDGRAAPRRASAHRSVCAVDGGASAASR